jgi:hypothetical protein
MKSNTDLAEGIVVYIKKDELNKLRYIRGFLEVMNYPDEWKEPVMDNEVGRLLFFRFLEIKESD